MSKYKCMLTIPSMFQSRMLGRCRSLGIRTPTVYYVDHQNSCIYMEYLKQSTVLKHFIDDNL